MNRDRAAASLDNYGWGSTTASHTAAYLSDPVLQLLGDAPGRRVLELGCGNGAFAEVLAKRGYDVVATDVAHDGIEQAKSRRTAAQFHVASVYEDDLEARLGTAFDAVVSLEVIEHLFYPKELFKAAHKLLKPGGLLVMSTPYHGYLKNLALSLTNGWDKHFGVAWDGGHIKFFSNASLDRMAAGHGFEQVAFRGAGRLPWLWKSTVLSARKR